MSSGKMYHHISDKEREQICNETKKGKSVRAIAKTLGRAPSTIIRELHKGCPDAVSPEDRMKGYNPMTSSEISFLARKRCGPKTKATPERINAIKHGIVKLRFSPEQIAGSDDCGEIGVSVSTMYRWLGDDNILGPYKKSLRRKGKRLKNGDRRRTRFADAKGIEERPQGCIDRTEFGHFEVDTVVSVKGKTACLFTAVDRKTRHPFIFKSDYCDTVGFDDFLKQLKKWVPEGGIKSITVDRGSEFANWKLMEEKYGIPIYFCNAHHPWEKGTNENTNGLIREFFPKKTDFTNVTQRDLYFKCIRFLHMRPRKVLGFKTSLDLFREECNNLINLKCSA